MASDEPSVPPPSRMSSAVRWRMSRILRPPVARPEQSHEDEVVSTIDEDEVVSVDEQNSDPPTHLMDSPNNNGVRLRVAVLDIYASSRDKWDPTGSPKKRAVPSKSTRRDNIVDAVRASLEPPNGLGPFSVEIVNCKSTPEVLQVGSYDVVVVSGQGTGAVDLSKELGVRCRAAIRRFVINGGGYIGIGSGAFLGLSGHHPGGFGRWDTSLRLLSAKPVNERCFSYFETEKAVARDLIRVLGRLTPSLQHGLRIGKVEGHFEEGMRVEANYKGKGRYYAGSISRDNNDGTYAVTYDESLQEREAEAAGQIVPTSPSRSKTPTAPTSQKSQLVPIEFTAEGEEILAPIQLSGSKFLARYANGPLMKATSEEENQAEAAATAHPAGKYVGVTESAVVSTAPGRIRTLAVFPEGAKKNPDDRFSPESSRGSGAVICGQTGRGRVVLMSANFESTPLPVDGTYKSSNPNDPDKQNVLARAVEWVGMPMLQTRRRILSPTQQTTAVPKGFSSTVAAATLREESLSDLDETSKEPDPVDDAAKEREEAKDMLKSARQDKKFSIKVNVKSASGLPHAVASQRMLVRVCCSVASADPVTRRQETAAAAWKGTSSDQVVWEEGSSLVWYVDEAGEAVEDAAKCSVDKIVIHLHAVDDLSPAGPAQEHVGNLPIGWLEFSLPNVGQIGKSITEFVRDLRGRPTATSLTVTVVVNYIGTRQRNVRKWHAIQKIKEDEESAAESVVTAASDAETIETADLQLEKGISRIGASWLAKRVDEMHEEQEHAKLIAQYESKVAQLRKVMQEVKWDVTSHLNPLQDLVTFFQSEDLLKTLEDVSNDAQGMHFSTNGVMKLLELANAQLERLQDAKALMDKLLMSQPVQIATTEEGHREMAKKAAESGPEAQRAFENETHKHVENKFGILVSNKCCTINHGPGAPGQFCSLDSQTRHIYSLARILVY